MTSVTKTTIFEFPISSGEYYAHWQPLMIDIIPLTIFTPKNDALIPLTNYQNMSIDAKMNVLCNNLDDKAMSLLRFLQKQFPHKLNQPGLEEDDYIHQFLKDNYPDYTNLENAKEQRKWLETKMAYLAKRGLIKEVYDKKKGNKWYSWALV